MKQLSLVLLEGIGVVLKVFAVLLAIAYCIDGCVNMQRKGGPVVQNSINHQK